MRHFTKAFLKVNDEYRAGATLRHSAIRLESEAGWD